MSIYLQSQLSLPLEPQDNRRNALTELRQLFVKNKLTSKELIRLTQATNNNYNSK